MSNEKIRRNAVYAYVFMGLMLLAFLAAVVLMTVPLGLGGQQLVWALRVSLYGILVLAAASAVFSVRVALLRKKSGLPALKRK